MNAFLSRNTFTCCRLIGHEKLLFDEQKMFVKYFSDLLGMHGHELVEFFCGYKLLGSGVKWSTRA